MTFLLEQLLRVVERGRLVAEGRVGEPDGKSRIVEEKEQVELEFARKFSLVLFAVFPKVLFIDSFFSLIEFFKFSEVGMVPLFDFITSLLNVF